MRILIISQYFYPEQFRINDMAVEWVKRGHEVTVVTGIPNYPQGKFLIGYGIFRRRRETYNGVNIIRLPIVPRGKSKLLLSINYISFVISGFFWKYFTRIKTDLVYIFEVSPMTQALPGVWFAKRNKLPCFLYVTDLWPENVQYLTGLNNKVLLSLLEKMVVYIYNNCNKIFTSSKSFLDAIENRGVSRNKLEYWPYYAEDFYKPIPISKICSSDTIIPQDGRFNFIFAGNIGEAQGLSVVVDAIALMSEDEKKIFRFVFVGDGRAKESIVKSVVKNQLEDNFLFIIKKPPEMIPRLFAQCDAALICLSKSPVFSMTIPAKTQSCLACGIPILLSADGEVQQIINEARCGVTADAGDPLALAQAIKFMINLKDNELKEMGTNALSYSSKHFNRDTLNERILEVFLMNANK